MQSSSHTGGRGDGKKNPTAFRNAFYAKLCSQPQSSKKKKCKRKIPDCAAKRRPTLTPIPPARRTCALQWGFFPPPHVELWAPCRRTRRPCAHHRCAAAEGRSDPHSTREKGGVQTLRWGLSLWEGFELCLVSCCLLLSPAEPWGSCTGQQLKVPLCAGQQWKLNQGSKGTRSPASPQDPPVAEHRWGWGRRWEVKAEPPRMIFVPDCAQQVLHAHACLGIQCLHAGMEEKGFVTAACCRMRALLLP